MRAWMCNAFPESPCLACLEAPRSIAAGHNPLPSASYDANKVWTSELLSFLCEISLFRRDWRRWSCYRGFVFTFVGGEYWMRQTHEDEG